MDTGLELIITFENTRDAIMGERLLLDAGVEVRVMPMPAQLGPSCGIALRLGQQDLERAQTLLGGTLRGIYRRSAGSERVFAPWNP